MAGELSISRPSLWNLLDCVDVDKTRAYLKRSKSLPLKVFLKKDEKGTHYPNDALQLVDPHIRRVWTLIVVADRENVLPDLVTHFSHRLPLLENLLIKIRCFNTPILDHTLFGVDLSSL